MPDFHNKPFDEGTIAKLEMFQLYAREWLPVFLSKMDPVFPHVHIFDFFAGPGMDMNGTSGSPLRMVDEVLQSRHRLADGKLKLHLHFSDASKAKIQTLRETMTPLVAQLPHTEAHFKDDPFEKAFFAALPILRDSRSAKLVLIDPCGVNFVDDAVFRHLIASPTTDFLMFVASSYLHRFSDHPAMKLRVKRSDSFYHCHRAVLEHYRSFIPERQRYHLAPYSIKKKGSQLYGLIFGSAHPLGMDKFLNAAWSQDRINGEANYDINREDFQETAPFLPMEMFEQPTKLAAFEADLKKQILQGTCVNESDVVDICFRHGVKRNHAESVLKELKSNGTIQCHFRVPQLDRYPPRPVRLL